MRLVVCFFLSLLMIGVSIVIPAAIVDPFTKQQVAFDLPASSSQRWYWGEVWNCFGGTVVRVSCGAKKSRISERESPIWARGILMDRNVLRQLKARQREVWIEARGWPFRAAYCRRILVFDGGSEATIKGGVALPGDPWLIPIGQKGSLAIVRGCPYNPLWLGLLGDMVVYFLVMWIGVNIPWTVRKICRRARGECTRCGYKLVEGPAWGCPECGWNRPESERAAGDGKASDSS